jgi:hypothetical protein
MRYSTSELPLFPVALPCVPTLVIGFAAVRSS